MKKNSYIYWIFRLSIVLLIFVSVFVLIKLDAVWEPMLNVLGTILVPFFIAAFITYLLHPVVEKLHELKVPRPIAIIVIYLLFFGGLGYGLYKVLPYTIQQLKDFTSNLPEYVDLYKTVTEDFYKQIDYLPEAFHEQVNTMLTSLEETLATIITGLLDLTKKLVSSFILFAIIPFISFYLLKDFDLVKKSVWYLTPRKMRRSGKRLLGDIDESLGNYIRGQLLVALIIGVCAWLALWLAGMKYPLLLGIIIGLTNIIPYFGPILGAVPAMIIALTISMKMVIIVIVIIFALQFLEGNLLSPLIVGKSLHMHPVIIIFALLIGEAVGGIFGLILAVPFFAVLKVVILHTKVHLSKH